MSQSPRSLPRFSLALLALFHAGVFAWASTTLPWHGPTPFAALSAVLATLHLVTSLTALAQSPWCAPVWRISAIASLAFLGYHTWLLFDAATYIAVLYGGLGRGVAAGLAAVWAVLVLFTLPLSAWGIAATGGIRRPRSTAAGSALLALVISLGLWRTANAAVATPLPTIAESPEALLPELAAITASLPTLPEGQARPSLMIREPVRCQRSPEEAGATAVLSFMRRTSAPDPQPFRPTRVCLQGEADELLNTLRDVLQDAALRGPMKLDIITATSPLTSSITAPDIFQIRPGIDGVCRLDRCFMPWNLVALDQFTKNKPLAFIDDLRFGIDSRHLMALFSGGEAPSERPALDGLTRISTWSLMVDVDGVPRNVPRLREPDLPLTQQTLSRGLALAERHILDAQSPDGRFRYLLNPFTGRVSWRGFAIPRQARTTLALCEVGSQREEVRKSVRSS
ncbi:MAG TPA: hypothetical protein ENK31_00015, partial [Nannocystis exedens]|nr:hypothetical protein [Nannocystis exedens]